MKGNMPLEKEVFKKSQNEANKTICVKFYYFTFRK